MMIYNTGVLNKQYTCILQWRWQPGLARIYSRTGHSSRICWEKNLQEEPVMEKQTAGRDALGGFAPKFAELNDDVLFGQVWAGEDKLSSRDRCIVTVSALMAKGILDSSLMYHIANAKKHGVTAEEMAEILTHGAFYAGWAQALGAV